MPEATKYLLAENDVPKAWYNASADLTLDLGPMLHPVTRQPADPAFLRTMFPQRFIAEMESRERWIEIPEVVRNAYLLWRPTPLVRARRLEAALDTPAHLYFKYEGGSPTGSHKLNTALPQAHYAREEGIRGMTTETGAGQWGSALSFACNLFGLGCHVYMVGVSYHQKPFRRLLMQNFGAEVFPSPSARTEYGRSVRASKPDHPGSLGIAVAEAVEEAIHSGGTWHFAFGSVYAPVLMHQSVIGLEARKQLELAGESPDVVVACVGAGSNWGGFVLPFLAERLRGGSGPRAIAAEPASCPSLTGGRYDFDHADSAGLTPLHRMYTLGKDFVPPPIHAGGLRYHGVAPIVSALCHHGVAEAVAVPQRATFAAALQFARAEGITPAPESAHAIRVAIDEAVRCKVEGVRRVIVFNVSGHGFFDLLAYDDFLNGRMEDYSPTA